MGLRAPAKWKKYHTGLFPWQLPNQILNAPYVALCSLRLGACRIQYPATSDQVGRDQYVVARLPQIWAQSTTIKGASYVQNSNSDNDSVGSHAQDSQINRV